MLERTIAEYAAIEGVRWVENVYVPTGTASGILLGGNISTNVVRRAGAETEYHVWGLHLATDDQLTFIEKADATPIVIKLVDCRLGSATKHRLLEISCLPDPSKRLVIPRGVAHLPMNLNGLVTMNTPIIYWDLGKRLVHPDLDVINIERDRTLADFPAYKVCRFRFPRFLYPAALAAFKARYRPGNEAPFIFERRGRLYVLRRKQDPDR